MKTFNRILLASVSCGILMGLPLAQAQGAWPDEASPQWHAGQLSQEIYSQLNLTDDQKRQLDANKRQHKTLMEGVRQQLRESKEALREELMKPQLNMPRVNELHNRLKALLSQAEDAKLASILTVRSILTPDQFAKFVNLMHKHGQEQKE